LRVLGCDGEFIDGYEEPEYHRFLRLDTMARLQEELVVLKAENKELHKRMWFAPQGTQYGLPLGIQIEITSEDCVAPKQRVRAKAA
jgi:hypothetical protein